MPGKFPGLAQRIICFILNWILIENERILPWAGSEQKLFHFVLLFWKWKDTFLGWFRADFHSFLMQIWLEKGLGTEVASFSVKLQLQLEGNLHGLAQSRTWFIFRWTYNWKWIEIACWFRALSYTYPIKL